MPWKEETVEKQRTNFINQAIEEGCNFSELCRQYNITRRTGYKWLERYYSGESLSDQSRAPLFRPRKTPPEIEDLLLSVRIKHPTWGPRKILRNLTNRGCTELPAPATVAAILKRNGFITPEESQAHTPYKRFVMKYPNDMWQMDFKGHFAMRDGNRCHPLTLTDDHSRMLLCLDAYENEQWSSVKASLLRIFDRFGLPKAILSDNGPPWGNSSKGYTLFDLWMMQLDILPIHGRILHPQTQGKEERFHRTLNQDVIKRVPIDNIAHAQSVFDAYMDEFNNERPHDALNLDIPAMHYRPSERRLPSALREPEYDSGKDLRKVNYKGYISISRKRYYISELFADRVLALMYVEDNVVALYYGNFIIARIDLDEQLVISKKIFRL